METVLLWAGTNFGFGTLLVVGFAALLAAGFIAVADAGRPGTAITWAMLAITFTTWVGIPHAAGRMIAPAAVLSSLDGCEKGAVLGETKPGDPVGEPIRMKHVRDVAKACEQMIAEAPKVLERARIREEQEKILRAGAAEL